MSAFDMIPCPPRLLSKTAGNRPLCYIYRLAYSVCMALFLYLQACTPPGYGENNREAGKVSIDLRDKTIQKIYDFGDARKVDSLIHYLGSTDATLRYIAAMSFASVRDSSAKTIAALTPLLRDEVEDLRIAAAFALGQIGRSSCEGPLLRAFVSRDSLSEHHRLNAVILEAVGKCGSLGSLKNLAAVTTYQPTDTLLLEGLCRAVYRFGLRGITDPAATAKMISYAANERIPAPARLMAAHFLARTKDISPDSAQAVQIAAGFVRAEGNPDIQMALAKALGKSQTGPAFAILSKAITRDQDWRVKCNLIGAMAKFDYDTVRSLVIPLIKDANPHVSRGAAEFFIENGQIKDADYYWRIARDNGALPIPTQIALYRASNRWLSGKTEPESKDYVNYRLKELFQQSKNPYDRAACLQALAEFGWNYRWIHDKGFNDAQAVVKSTAAEALTGIMQRPNFYGFFGEAAKGVRREMYLYLREVVGSGDPGMIAAASEGFKTEALNFRSMRDSARLEDFYASLSKLKKPRDVEAIIALEKVIAYFEEKPAPASYQPVFNHPIDWNRLNTLNTQTEITLQTTKGPITVEMYPHSAPGSVANFLELAGTGFFNGKTFHRVVSNFVIQGGCPRGDGYGGLDYSIRTEIGLHWYDGPGYLGMASAGPDTEGTQFFITHSPTPHLDSRYTIFGKVTKGMEVVHQIQQGDIIEKVE